jgi:excinuclease ABC subunit B
LSDKGVRVRYLHSSIDTVERVEILRDLRLGAFDVLVGINLLREGLDLPEVELVAVLDADKEGFLRSTTSLIQTIGRAARNLKGRVILYADRITKSMQQAMDETSRRREIQKAYNQSHGLTPQAIRKAVRDSLNVGGGTPAGRSSNKVSDGDINQQVETTESFLGQEGVSFEKQLKQLESEMKKKASQLDFEAAADIRDQIVKLKQAWLGNG